MPAERVMAAMETGSMITMANGITSQFSGMCKRSCQISTAMCPAGSPAFDSTTGPRWTGWGQNTNNTRFQDAGAAGLTAADIPKLKLKWAFAFPGDLQSYSQASIVGGRIFVGSWGGTVYSLNAATGCIHWFFDAGQGVRSAISVGRVGNRDIAVFGDAQANVYALDAATGKLLWKTDVDDFPVGRIHYVITCPFETPSHQYSQNLVVLDH